MSPLVLAVALAAADPTTAEELAPHAAGVALIEVTDVTVQDARERDGPLEEVVSFRTVRGSGDIPDEIRIVKRYGRRPADAPDKPPKWYVPPGALRPGQRYWVAFASRHQLDRYREGVIDYWPEGDPRAAKLLAAAVKADRYGWHPQYHPETGLTYGRVEDPAKDVWRVRVVKAGKVLWEVGVPGSPRTLPRPDYALRMVGSRHEGLPSRMPESGYILVADSSRKLDEKNEFDLPPNKYYVGTVLDPESGDRLAAWVRHHGEPWNVYLRRDYDPKTGKVRAEERLDSGGKVNP